MSGRKASQRRIIQEISGSSSSFEEPEASRPVRPRLAPPIKGRGGRGRRIPMVPRPFRPVSEVPVSQITEDVKKMVISDLTSVKHWSDELLTKQSLIRFNAGIPLSKEAIQRSVAAVKSNKFKTDVITSLDGYIYHLISEIGPVGAFIVRVDAHSFSTKRAVGTLKILTLFLDPIASLERYSSKRMETDPDFIPPHNQFDWLKLLDTSTGLLKSVRDYQTELIAKKAKVPESTKQLMLAVETLSSTIKDYVNADDDVIDHLNNLLTDLRKAKQERINEVAPIRSKIAEFNSARGGQLSDAEKLVARRDYDAEEKINSSLSYEAYVAVMTQAKAQSVISSGMDIFRDLGDDSHRVKYAGNANHVHDESMQLIKELGQSVGPDLQFIDKMDVVHRRVGGDVGEEGPEEDVRMDFDLAAGGDL